MKNENKQLRKLTLAALSSVIRSYFDECICFYSILLINHISQNIRYRIMTIFFRNR
jgi:hypothetical protein